jgi:hypothetical protein
MLSFGVQAQNKTKDGFLMSWDKEVVTGNDSIPGGSLKVPAFTVPVYEARPSDVMDHLKTVLPMATFKESAGILSANAVNLPEVATGPVDILARVTENKKGGYTTLALAMLQNGVPVVGDASVQRSTVRDIGVKLNKAVVQEQLATWENKLTKAGERHEDAKADREKAQGKVVDANADLEKAVSKRGTLQKDIANIQADITRQEVRWQTSQNPKDLKKLTKLREKLSKSEKKLADAMADESKTQKSVNKRQEAVPDAMKDNEKLAQDKESVQRTVDALKRKLDNIR